MGRRSKLTAHQRREAPQRREAGEPTRKIARSFNVSHSKAVEWVQEPGMALLLLRTRRN